MNQWPGASFFGSLQPAGAQNETLISNTGNISSNVTAFGKINYEANITCVSSCVLILL